MVNSYAGVGSRNITHVEALQIDEAAKWLASHEYVLYSGNAEGADQAFQRGSGGKCVIMLPWAGYNQDGYPVERSLEAIVCGDTREAQESVAANHPAAGQLTSGSRALLGRNRHQVMGVGKWPPVDFLLCCADETMFGVKGGTGQTVRVARSIGIPVINIRVPGWQHRLTELLAALSV